MYLAKNYYTRDVNEERFYLLTVIVDNGLKDTEFVLGYKQLREIGLIPGDVKRYLSPGKHFSGMSIEQIDKSEVPNYYLGVPEAVAKLLKTDRRYFKVNITPVIGTVLLGKYQGYQFSLFGKTEIEEFFNFNTVRRTLKNKGCSFNLVSHREAIPLHGKFTPEIKAFLKENLHVKPETFCVIGTVLEGRHAGLNFGLIGNREIEVYFNNGNVHSMVTGRLKKAYNCTFEKVSPELALKYHGVLTKELVKEIREKV